MKIIGASIKSMAVEAQSYSENLGISQQWLMNTTTTTTPNLSLPIFLPPQGFMENMERGIGMGMGMGFHGCQGFVSSPCSSSSTTDIATLLQKQNHDLDLYLHFQGEKLRQVLHQQKMRELVLLLNSYQSREMTLLRQKMEDLENLRMKTKIFEDYLKRAEQETEAWQRIAMEKEKTLIGLTNMLEQVKSNQICVVPTPTNHHGSPHEEDNDDAESVCDFEPVNRKNRGDAGEERENRLGFDCICRWCHMRCSSVVFLPCKHLCCCKPCEGVLGLCPVCHSVKQGSIEIFLS